VLIMSGVGDQPVAVQVPDPRLVLAYEAAQDMLKIQDSTLANTRTRANNLLAAAALIISISFSQKIVDPDTVPTVGIWAMLVVSVALGVSVLSVLWTVRDWDFGPSARVISERIAQGQSEDEIRTYVVQAMIEGIKLNRDALDRRQRVFRFAASLLVLEIAVMILLVALG
jgi:hypothetical protein